MYAIKLSLLRLAQKTGWLENLVVLSMKLTPVHFWNTSKIQTVQKNVIQTKVSRNFEKIAYVFNWSQFDPRSKNRLAHFIEYRNIFLSFFHFSVSSPYLQIVLRPTPFCVSAFVSSKNKKKTNRNKILPFLKLFPQNFNIVWLCYVKTCDYIGQYTNPSLELMRK